MKNHQGFCYVWHEGEGDITAHEFASIICSFITDQNVGEGEEVIIYSDNCGYQNKNSTLSNALFNLAIDKKIIITQKYLEKGHTQMEVNSMHACIERRLKNRHINIPAEYAAHCTKARQSNPYKVQYLNHTFFRNYDKVNYLSSIRPGTRPGEPTVNDLKVLKYTPSKEIYSKLDYTDDWSLLKKRFKKKVQAIIPNDSLPNLYTGPRQITKEKFDNLQELKSTLLADFHTFYDQLKFK